MCGEYVQRRVRELKIGDNGNIEVADREAEAGNIGRDISSAVENGNRAVSEPERAMVGGEYR